MKKKGIATLALAGALAVSMVPAFAANSNQATVGYTAGGNVDGDGRVMVTVPKDVNFTNTQKKITGFDVKALVWDTTTSTWVTPDATTLTKSIDVTVTSTNEYKLKNDTDAAGVEGEYTYTVDAGVMTNDSNAVGTLTGTTHTIAGTLDLTKAPKLGQTETAVFFSDTLTFSFTNMT